MKRTLAGVAIVLTFGMGAINAGAQSGIIDATKQAGHATKEATKDAAKVAGDTAKEAGKAAEDTTKNAATKTKNAVKGHAQASCADGTKQEAKTQKSADALCAKHGGLARH